MSGRTAVLVAAAVALGVGARPGTAQSRPPCPPAVPDSAADRYGQVIIDGKQVGAMVMVKRENRDPETFEIVGPEPPALEALPVAKIDLIEYLRGPKAEQRFHLCPGVVAIVISTKQ